MIVEQEKTKIENRASKVELREDGIVSILIKSDLEFEIKDIDDINISLEQLGATKEILLLVDVRENTFGSKEVKEYAVEHGAANKHGLATAFVTKSLGQKIIINFFMKYFSHRKPLKLFNDFDSAIKWLKTFK